MSKNAYLLLKNDDGRFSIVIDNKPYILIQPPHYVLEQFELEEDARLIKSYQVGRAIIYVDDGQEKVIFEVDIEDTIENLQQDGIDTEQMENLEMVDVIWLV
jgi:hypothetical protein